MTPNIDFHFFTLVTRDEQYEGMRESLAHVGFNDSNSVFTVLDNRGGRNVHEPFSAITKAVKEAQAPYVVFCHQDLVFYHGPEALLEAIRGVEARDPQWAVLGNAGVTASFEMAIDLVHPDASHNSHNLPARVLTLDEDFLVIRRHSGVGCSPELSGFHLYGTDLCLNAYLKGFSAWVIEYRLMHICSTLDFPGLHRLARRFHKVWGKRINGAVIINPVIAIVFSRIPFLFAAANRVGVRDRLVHRFRPIRTLDYLLRHGRPNWLPMARYGEGDPRGPRLSWPVRLVDSLLRRGRSEWSPSARYEEYDAADLERHWKHLKELQSREREQHVSGAN